jgi:hypothetical protein
MVIVQIHALPPPEAERTDMCLSAAIDGVAAAMKCPTSEVWAQFLPVSAMHIGNRPVRFNGHCPVVVVRTMHESPPAQVRAALTALASGIAAAMDLPVDDIWIQWQQLQPGTVFAAGAIQEP